MICLLFASDDVILGKRTREQAIEVLSETLLNSTQLNKPPQKVAHKRKEAHKSLIISPILKITVKSLFNNT